MKPTKCWDCALLGKCVDYDKGVCKDFVMWKLTFKEVANLCNINERTLYRWFNKSESKALRTIYHLTGYKFQVYYDSCRRYLIRKLDREKDNAKREID